MPEAQRIRYIDSHTGGEPTRVVLSGGPRFQGRSVAEKRHELDARYDDFRAAVVNEPRGSDVLIGALLVDADTPDAVTGVIYFNNVGTLNMCGHGTIGLVETLRHLGRVEPGPVPLDTPVGRVTAMLHENGEVSFENVPAYRTHKGVTLTLDSGQTVSGDIAWGGNLFFLCDNHGQALEYERVGALTEFAWSIRRALKKAGLTDSQGAELDHIELIGPPTLPGATAKSFMLCPGGAYDRSPCGTGTSAKLACLFEDGKINETDTIVIESITGSTFKGQVRVSDAGLIPIVTGRAWITAEGELLRLDDDPLKDGLPTPSRST